MFEDALFATNRRRTPQQRWAAAMSFAVQAGLVTVLVALPLFFTEALPLNYVRSIVELPSPPPGPPPTPPENMAIPHRQQLTTLFEDGRVTFHPPATGPIQRFDDTGATPQPNVGGPYVPGSTGPGGSGNDPISQMLAHMPHTVAPPPPPSKPVILSHVDEGLLIHKVMPVYPQIAMITRQQGTVVLHAIIGRDGSIQQLQVVSGPPLLMKAAMDAVAQWRYKPYQLNGQPVEVDTQITVNFKLGG